MRTSIGFVPWPLILTGLVWRAGLAQDNPPKVVTVPDPALQAVLQDSLGLAAGEPIPAATLAELTAMEATDLGIVDLTGLEHATGLTRLDLGGGLDGLWANSNEVSDLSPLSALTDLTWLDLSGNSVEDVTPLSGLTNLTYLNLQLNVISDVSPLSGLTSLTDLYLAFNPLRDASSLSHLAALTVHDMPSRDENERFPANLDHNLIRIILFYEEALAKGTATDLAFAGPCQHLSASVFVTVVTDTPENADAVGEFLEQHGVAVWWPIREAAREGIGQGLGCVPVPLLVALSKLPGVTWVEKGIASRPPPTIPTAVEEASWGAVKERSAGGAE